MSNPCVVLFLLCITILSCLYYETNLITAGVLMSNRVMSNVITHTHTHTRAHTYIHMFKFVRFVQLI